MTNSDANDTIISPEEQGRAERLAVALDRLLTGQLPDLDDPVIDVATQLAHLSIGPSASAQAQFEQQLSQWFGNYTPSRARSARLTLPIFAVIILVVLAIIVGIIIGLLFRGTGFNSLTATATVTGVPTPSLTIPPSLTATVTPSASVNVPTSASATQIFLHTTRFTATVAATVPVTIAALDLSTTTVIGPSPAGLFTESPSIASVTPITFARIVISGRIENASVSQIVVFGQPIQIDGGVSGLCTNDLVIVEAFALPDGMLHAARSGVTIQIRGCANVMVAPSPVFVPAVPGKSDTDNDHHHD